MIKPLPEIRPKSPSHWGRPIRVRFSGNVDADQAADEFILAFLARHKGGSVTVAQVWKSLQSRGLVPADGTTPETEVQVDETAVAEISSRLEKWFSEGLVGGEKEPESITGKRHFWALGSPPT